MLAVEYAARAIEQKLATREPQGKFKTGKLLIRFASARRGRQLLVVYSEDFLDPRVERLLREVAVSDRGVEPASVSSPADRHGVER